MDLIFPLVHESKDKGGRVQVSKQYQRKDQAKTLIMIAKEKGWGREKKKKKKKKKKGAEDDQNVDNRLSESNFIPSSENIKAKITRKL